MFSPFVRKDDKQIYNVYQSILLEQEDRVSGPMMDDKTFKEFDEKLTRAKYKLYRDYPFFGILLTKLRTVPTKDIPTMAVDDNGNIYINPEFVLKQLSDDETTGVLAHETMHIATLTFFRLRGRQMKLWNIATDYIMNRDLLQSGLKLPKMGLIPEVQGGNYYVKIEGMQPIDITDETAEGLYDKLQQAGKQQQEQFQKALDKLSEKQEELDKHLTPGEAEQIQPEEVPSDNDSYKPEKPGQGQPEKTTSEKAAEQKSKVQGALQEAERTRGDQAGVPRSFNKKLLQPKTDWKRLLRDFVTSSSRSSYDWARPQRRALATGYYAPRLKVEQEDLDVVVGIDTSGSITEDMIRVFVSELVKIMQSFKKVKITLLLWNTNVYYEYELDTKKKSINQIQQDLLKLPYQGGGTEISSIKKYIDSKDLKNKKINGLLVFTDGHVEQSPSFPQTNKKLFLITDGGTEEILKKFGPTYSIDVPRS